MPRKARSKKTQPNRGHQTQTRDERGGGWGAGGVATEERRECLCWGGDGGITNLKKKIITRSLGRGLRSRHLGKKVGAKLNMGGTWKRNRSEKSEKKTI